MPEIVEIPPSNLIVDSENPRLRVPNLGKREALKLIASEQKQKLVALARDIVEFGLNPSDLPIVVPLKNDLNRYRVLEGNRRLSALMVLENPDIIKGAIEGSILAKLRSLSKKYQESPIEFVNCLVVKSVEEARHWIELRHTGQNEGAGIVPWHSEEASRFRARSGKLPIESQVLDFLESQGKISTDDRQSVQVTSFRRLLSTPEIRDKSGIDVEKGQVKLVADKNKAAKALAHIALNIPRTQDIYTKAQRVQFAKRLPKNIAVKRTLTVGRDLPTDTSKRSTKRKTKKKVRRARARDHLIPHDCILQVSNERVREIESELRALSIESYPNAIGVLLRVFIELTVDSYIDVNGLSPANEKLTTKTLAVVEDLLHRKKLTTQQARPVRKACIKNSYLAPSISVMNEYVHNQYAFPLPSDLRAYWSSLQPFFMAIWS